MPKQILYSCDFCNKQLVTSSDLGESSSHLSAAGWKTLFDWEVPYSGDIKYSCNKCTKEKKK